MAGKYRSRSRRSRRRRSSPKRLRIKQNYNDSDDDLNVWKITGKNSKDGMYKAVYRENTLGTMITFKDSATQEYWLDILKNLAGIPGIPEVYDSWTDGDKYYIVIQRVYECNRINTDKLTYVLDKMKERDWLYVSGPVKCASNKELLLVNFNNTVKKQRGTYPNHKESKLYKKPLTYSELETIQDLNMLSKFYSEETKINADQMKRGIQRKLFALSKVKKSGTNYKPILSAGLRVRNKHIIDDCKHNEKWNKQQLLGHGLSGKVFTACPQNNPHDCNYALKTQHADEMFYNEVSALRELTNVFGIPKIYDAWVCNGIGHMVMEKLYTVDYISKRDQKIIEKIRNSMLANNWLYTDLHSGNVMKNVQGNLVLTDFGWAVKKRKGVYPEHPLSKSYGRPLRFEELVDISKSMSLS